MCLSHAAINKSLDPQQLKFEIEDCGGQQRIERGVCGLVCVCVGIPLTTFTSSRQIGEISPALGQFFL